MIKSLKSKLSKLFKKSSEKKTIKQQSQTPQKKRNSDNKPNNYKSKANTENSKKSYNKNRRRPPKKHNSASKNNQPKIDPELKKKIPPKPDKIIVYDEKEDHLRFTDFPLHDDIIYGIQDQNFKYCTPIQAMCLPHTLDKKDLVGKAQTGTGKTAAFLISAFHRILTNPIENKTPGSCRILVLAPTRELAIQIHKDR